MFCRRDFLIATAGMVARGLIPSIPGWARAESSAVSQGKLLCGVVAPGSSFPKTAIAYLEIHSNKARFIEVERLVPHSLLPLNDFERVIVISKYGQSVAMVNLKASKTERHVTLPAFQARHFFQGHGCLSHDGQLAYLTMNTRQEGGYLSVRDTKTLREVERLYSGGLYPHDIVALKGGRVAAVTNVKTIEESQVLSRGSIVLIELSSGKILERESTPDENVWLNHIATSQNDTLIINGVKTQFGVENPNSRQILDPTGHEVFLSAPVFLKVPGKSMKRMMDSQALDRMKYGMSIAVAEKLGLVAVSHLEGHCITLWSLQSGQFRKLIPCDGEKPLGLAVSADQKSLIIANESGSIRWVTLSQLDTSSNPQFARSVSRFLPSWLPSGQITGHLLWLRS